jgi:hypothetical protein
MLRPPSPNVNLDALDGARFGKKLDVWARRGTGQDGQQRNIGNVIRSGIVTVKEKEELGKGHDGLER